QFLYVRLPAALPSFFTGLRIAITWSVTAAIFGEYVGAEKGLGIFMQVAKNDFRTDLVLAAVFVVSMVSLLLFGAVVLVRRLVIPWHVAMKAGERR
ncbi:MAG: ABC transporter permease, partial [Pseudodonghicola sp.]